MEPILPDDQMRGLAALCGDDEKLRALAYEVAERQSASLDMHSRGLLSLSGAPAQLPYEAALMPVCVAAARGAHIRDIDGNEFIDCHMGYTASILGHNPEPVVQAVREALDRSLGAGHFFEEQIELAELVRDLVPGTQRVAFFHTGGEAVGVAVRLARAATGRTKVAKFEGCYHGSNEIGLHNPWMLLTGRVPEGATDAITPAAATAGLSPRAAEDFLILPYNSTTAFELIRKHAAELACVVADPSPPFMSSWIEDAAAFITELRAVTREAGVPLLLDEVVSGFRLARGGAQEAYGVDADLACFGKITSGLGIPLSIVCGRAALMDRARSDGMFLDYGAGKAWVSSTNSCNFLAIVAALAQLELVASAFDELITELDDKQARLRGELASFSQETGIPVTVHGHPRLQPVLTFQSGTPRVKEYREILKSSSPAEFRSLMALSLCLRLHGVYTKVAPTMNLSAAHTEDDVRAIAEAVKRSLLRMREDGLLP